LATIGWHGWMKAAGAFNGLSRTGSGMSERPGFTGEMMLHARMLYLDPQEIINKLVQAQS